MTAFQTEMIVKIDVASGALFDQFWTRVAPLLQDADEGLLQTIADGLGSETYLSTIQANYEQATTVAWSNFLAQLHNGASSAENQGGAIDVGDADWLTNPKRQQLSDSHGVLMVELDVLNGGNTRFHGIAVHHIEEKMKIRLRALPTVGTAGLNTLVRIYPEYHQSTRPQAVMTILLDPTGTVKRVERAHEIGYSVDPEKFAQVARDLPMSLLK